MRVFVLFTFLFVILFSLFPQSSMETQLVFDDEKFKIIQFTDLHYSTISNKKQNDSTLYLIKELILKEKPDLVVFTGDVVVFGPPTQGWDEVLQTVIDLKTPYVVTFGNHDGEGDFSNEELLEYIKKKPYNITFDEDESISGSGNCSFVVRSSDKKESKWALYFFDSHAYSDNSKVGGYGWVKHDQIQWYIDRSNEINENSESTIPALAFFHIPFHEYEIVRNRASTIGNKTEGVCHPAINSGLFTAFVDQKDVKGVFVGHDHNNDFVGELNGILLTYGRKSGYAPAYDEILERGARVIELYESDTKFKTYITTLEGEEFEYTF